MKLEERINQYYDTFSANDRYICECILNHKEACIHNSIDEFAYTYHISTSTLSRFAQKLKLPGYSELRAMIRLDYRPQDSPYHNREHMMDCYKKVIDDIDKKDCTLLFEEIHKAQRIIVFGEGYSQGRVAKEMKRMFLPTGKRIYDMYGVDMLSSLRSFVTSEDIVVLISFHGESKELVEFANHLRMRGIYTISITKMVRNTLSQCCCENLYISSLLFELDNDETYEITTPYFILIELLYIKYEMYLKSMNIIP